MKRLLLIAAVAALVLPAAALAWGGAYPANDALNSQVDVQVSDAYPVDQALPQEWATFLGSLVHGAALAQVHLRLLPSNEVSAECGVEALACYDPNSQTIYATPEDQLDEPAAKEVVIHEYGHHVANNLSDAPWPAEDWGTKRWSSYENVCRKTEQGLASPGDEGRNYQQNPGEAFAETYRMLNLTKQGVAVADIGWDIVDQAFYPDATALSLLEQDITTPWTRNTLSHLSGSFGNGVVRTFTVKTTLDGTFAASLKKPVKAKMTLALYAGKRLIARGATVRARICGQRSLTLKVQRASGRGAFTIAVSRP